MPPTRMQKAGCSAALQPPLSEVRTIIWTLAVPLEANTEASAPACSDTEYGRTFTEWAGQKWRKVWWSGETG